MTRRHAMLLGFGALVTAAAPARVQAATQITAWREPSCGCCSGWVAHLRGEGFVVEDQVVRSLAPVRRRLGTPADLMSCHAGQVEGLALEGHVPAAAIRRLLAERPVDLRGLAVPEMPVGSPGMEVSGVPMETYDVIGFGTGAPRPFMRFRGAQPA